MDFGNGIAPDSSSEGRVHVLQYVGPEIAVSSITWNNRHTLE